MPLVSMSFVVFRGLAALLAATTLIVLCQSASAADLKRPVVVAPAPLPTGSELVGKLLSEQNGPSDPDVPMPQPGLSRTQDRATPSAGPQIYGRQEDGGAVLGLKFPIPATRGIN
jgi:hypothetical protein